MRFSFDLRRHAVDSEYKTLAVGCKGNFIATFDLVKGGDEPRLENERKLEGHTDSILSLAFHPTEPRLASGSKDRTIKLWDTETWIDVTTLRRHLGRPQDLAFSRDGLRLASASSGHEGRDNSVKLWEAIAEEDLPAIREQRYVERRGDTYARWTLNRFNFLDRARRALEWKLDDNEEPVDIRIAAERMLAIRWKDSRDLLERAADVFSEHGRSVDEYERAFELINEANDIAGRTAFHRAGIKELLAAVLSARDDVDMFIEGVDLADRDGTAPAAQVLEALGHVDSAWQLLEDLTDELSVRFARMQMLARPDDHADLRADLAIGLDLLDETSSETVRREIAHFYDSLDDVESALVILDQSDQESISTLNSSGWIVVKRPDRTRSEYETAIKQIERALMLGENDWAILNLFGVARFRIAQLATEDERQKWLDDAITTLERSNRGNGLPHSSNDIFLTMAHHLDGDFVRRDNTTERFRELRSLYPQNSELDAFIAEARSLGVPVE